MYDFRKRIRRIKKNQREILKRNNTGRKDLLNIFLRPVYLIG